MPLSDAHDEVEKHFKPLGRLRNKDWESEYQGNKAGTTTVPKTWSAHIHSSALSKKNV